MNGRMIDFPGRQGGIEHSKLVIQQLIAQQLQPIMVKLNKYAANNNYLLEELYIATNGKHEAFTANPKLSQDVATAVELRKAQKERLVKTQVPTPEFTKEQLKKLDAEKNK
jgi:hypothetical protein